jgi:hypothetical protein
MFWLEDLLGEKSQLEKCSNLIGCCKSENCSGIIPNLIGSKIGISMKIWFF